MTDDEKAMLLALRKRVDAKKLEWEEEEKALRVMERLLSGSNFSISVSPPQKNGNVINIDDLGIDDVSGRETLKDYVKNAVQRLGVQEFNVSHVDAVLKKMGVEISGKHPRSRISVVLGKLEQDGVLIRTFTGGGNVPNRYRLKVTEEML